MPPPPPPQAPPPAPAEDVDMRVRMDAIASALWEGVQKVAEQAKERQEQAAERQELLERCVRAESAARKARELSERLASRVASHLSSLTSEDGATEGESADVASTPAMSARPTPAPRLRHPEATQESRETFGVRGRSRFESQIRSAARRNGTTTPAT